MTTPAAIGSLSDRSLRERLRFIPPIETFPRFLAFAQTAAGKLIIVALFGLGLASLFEKPWQAVPIVLCLALMSFLPRYRKILLCFSTLIVSTIETRSLYFLGAVGLGVVLFAAARRWPQSAFGRRPLAFLLGGYTLLILSVCVIPKSSILFSPAWQIVGIVTKYIWFIGYMLLDRTALLRKDLALEAGSLQPFWGSSNTPFPKGAAYLRRIEARDAAQLATTQLKALKLLAWALILNFSLSMCTRIFHTYYHIPLASEALAMSALRKPYPWYVCWESQILSFFEGILQISIFGHRIIACCRMAGFNALRNTYRPLSSTTVIEFFNRLYYYFKELLVEFFFYPTFLRYFKRWPILRLVTATFAAAAFGNMFYHFTRDYWIIQKVGLAEAFRNFQVFAFYCMVLATALSISELRRRHAKPPSGFIRGQLIPATGVVLLYVLLDVFGSTQRNYPLIEHFRFLAHLLGLNF
jgi:hypothetical protein